VGILKNIILTPLTIVIFTLVTFTASVVVLFKAFAPKRLQEIIPLLEVTIRLWTQISLLFSDPERLAAEKAIAELEGIGDQVDEVVRGYAIRKGVGQSVDNAISGFALVALGVGAWIAQSDNPLLFFYLFGTATMALSTFAGVFGPPYALFQLSKSYCLGNGNYRAATFYKQLEAIFALPFISATLGFLILDVPPVDKDTLEDFKDEVGESIYEAREKLTSLLGGNKGLMTKKTSRLIGELMSKNEQTLASLDFRNIREEKAREFALEYYQKEFSIFPWQRKKVAKEFAQMHNFTLEEAENTLRLISFKITAGQEDEDLVNNIMVTGALKGMIMLESNYKETYADLELGQISTGLAFGARQFLKDHYLIRSREERIKGMFYNIFLFIVAVPWIFAKSFVQYSTMFFDYWVKLMIANRDTNIMKSLVARYLEVNRELQKIPGQLRNKFFPKKDPNERVEEIEKEPKTLRFKRIIIRVGRGFIEFVILPFKVIVKVINMIVLKIQGKNIDVRNQMAAELGHAALLSMYNELYVRLVQQSHVSSSF
jgi:hypothetical protein